MPYSQQTWNNGALGATPISAARLNHMEAGISAAIAKGDHVVSVKDYGALGNGSANDTAAIASAYTAAAGKPLYFPKGSYKVTALPALVDGDRLVGAGPLHSEIVYAGTGTLLPLSGRQDIGIRSLGFAVTGVGAKVLDLDACFQVSLDDVRIRGVHDGTTGSTYRGQKGVVLRGNTGNTRIHNTVIANLGVGIETSCIQNEITNSKVVNCYTSVHGVGGTANAGLVAVGCEFIADTDPDTCRVHVDIDGSANTWALVGCWFEGSDYAAIVGEFGSGGPSSYAMLACKIAARIEGIQFNSCRQPSIAFCEFNLDAGGTMTEVTFASDGDEVIEGYWANNVTTLRFDFADEDIPQYWNAFRRGSGRIPNLTVSSNAFIAGALDTGGLKIRNGSPGVGKVWTCTNVDGSGSWQ